MEHPTVLRAVHWVMMAVLVASAVAHIMEKSKQPPPCSPGCPDGWFRSQGRCYYFSKAEGNWTYSQNNCSSLSASLSAIESPEALASLLPYPGRLDHWIGLRKDAGGVWRWVNGTEFDHRFGIRGGADCAYLDDDLKVSCSGCSTPRKWFCSRPDAPTQGTEHFMGGKLQASGNQFWSSPWPSGFYLTLAVSFFNAAS